MSAAALSLLTSHLRLKRIVSRSRRQEPAAVELPELASVPTARVQALVLMMAAMSDEEPEQVLAHHRFALESATRSDYGAAQMTVRTPA